VFSNEVGEVEQVGEHQENGIGLQLPEQLVTQNNDIVE
jgi:hypothetical protein